MIVCTLNKNQTCSKAIHSNRFDWHAFCLQKWTKHGVITKHENDWRKMNKYIEKSWKLQNPFEDRTSSIIRCKRCAILIRYIQQYMCAVYLSLSLSVYKKNERINDKSINKQPARLLARSFAHTAPDTHTNNKNENENGYVDGLVVVVVFFFYSLVLFSLRLAS